MNEASILTRPRVAKLTMACLTALGTAVPFTVHGQADDAQERQQSQSAQQDPGSSRSQSARQDPQSGQNQSARSGNGEDPNSESASASSDSGQGSATQSDASAEQQDTQVARADSDVSPYTQPDDTWISINGTVDSVSPDAFILDYGDGIVTVEMDDVDRDAEAYSLLPGDRVEVNGLIDDDFFEATSIEASSVYIEKIGTRFYANSLDEEDFYTVSMVTPIDPSLVAVQGTVTEVSGDDFTIDTGARSVRVDVEEMSYDPMDEEGYQRIEEGDLVVVHGQIDNDFFTGREIEANAVTTLIEELG
ncbi:MAG: hypothetical protein JXB36_15705 [Gammaproteobacteria bacterium]|nr:hypothetical protein [Gammaproteobacteria bacterium]